MPRHVRKGDTVVVISGAAKGKVGEVLRVDAKNERVLVKGVNLRTKHVKPTQQAPQGAIITKEMPIHWSNVNISVDGKPSRVRFETKKDGSKARVAVRGGSTLNTVRGPKG